MLLLYLAKWNALHLALTQQHQKGTKFHTKTDVSCLNGGAEFARKGGGNYKEMNIQGKAPQFASVWICKELIYLGNQKSGIRKEQYLQGTELARSGGGICKEWILWNLSQLCLEYCGLSFHRTRCSWVVCNTRGAMVRYWLNHNVEL